MSKSWLLVRVARIACRSSGREAEVRSVSNPTMARSPKQTFTWHEDTIPIYKASSRKAVDDLHRILGVVDCSHPIYGKEDGLLSLGLTTALVVI